MSPNEEPIATKAEIAAAQLRLELDRRFRRNTPKPIAEVAALYHTLPQTSDAWTAALNSEVIGTPEPAFGHDQDAPIDERVRRLNFGNTEGHGKNTPSV